MKISVKDLRRILKEATDVEKDETLREVMGELKAELANAYGEEAVKDTRPKYEFSFMLQGKGHTPSFYLPDVAEIVANTVWMVTGTNAKRGTNDRNMPKVTSADGAIVWNEHARVEMKGRGHTDADGQDLWADVFFELMYP